MGKKLEKFLKLRKDINPYIKEANESSRINKNHRIPKHTRGCNKTSNIPELKDMLSTKEKQLE